MLTLYTKPGCPFCAKVLTTLEEKNIQFEEKSIADEAVAGELIERGGKRMVPYIIDTERGVAMYESDDIVAYLLEHCASPTEEGGEGSEA